MPCKAPISFNESINKKPDVSDALVIDRERKSFAGMNEKYFID
jgi:hypothetical protein